MREKCTSREGYRTVPCSWYVSPVLFGREREREREREKGLGLEYRETRAISHLIASGRTI